MDRITGKTYLVTGASSGIGEQIAHRLADLGAAVYGAARHLPKAYTARAGRFIPLVMDVTNDASVAQAAQQVLSEAGGIYVLFPFLSRLLPYRLIEKILGSMYHVKG